MLEKILELENDLLKVNDVLAKHSYEEALTIIAMLLEENCKRNDKDMIECVEGLLTVSKEVREQCGVY